MENPKKIRPALADLAPGQHIDFDLARLKSVRTQASELGAILNRVYTTRVDRDERIIRVTRTDQG